MAFYLLDTNVLSELMRSQPDPRVMAWFAAQADAEYFTTAISQAEILLGIALLPKGKRRSSLSQTAMLMFQEDFSGRCLPFDDRASGIYALLVASRREAGRPITTEDAQIAAIALTHQLTLVTRNIKDFVHIGKLKIVNPWED